MKAFISGVAGLIGSNLARHLGTLGIEAIGCDNLTGGYEDNIPTNVSFYPFDCRDPRIKDVIKGCDVVYHCAAHAYEGLSNFSPFLVSESIFSPTAALLSAAIQAKVSRFIYCSSMARYGRQTPPFDESLPTSPVDPYGIAKVAGEELIKNLCHFHKLEYVIIVPHNVFGVGQRYDDPYRNVIAIMLNRMLQDKSPVIYGDGLQVRSFTPIMDAIVPIARAGTVENAANQIINVGTGPEMAINMKTLVEMLNAILDKKIPPLYIEGRPNEVASAYCTNNKAHKILGFTPSNAIKDELRRMADWIKSRGTKPFNYNLEIEIQNQHLFKVWKDKML